MIYRTGILETQTYYCYYCEEIATKQHILIDQHAEVQEVPTICKLIEVLSKSRSLSIRTQQSTRLILIERSTEVLVQQYKYTEQINRTGIGPQPKKGVLCLDLAIVTVWFGIDSNLIPSPLQMRRMRE